MIIQRHPDNLVYIRNDDWSTVYCDTIDNFRNECKVVGIPYIDSVWDNEFIYYSTAQRLSTIYNRRNEVIVEGVNSDLEVLITKVELLCMAKKQRNALSIPVIVKDINYWYDNKYIEIMESFNNEVCTGHTTTFGITCQITNEAISKWYYGLIHAKMSKNDVIPVVCDYNNELHYNIPVEQFEQIFNEMCAFNTKAYIKKWKLRKLLNYYKETNNMIGIKSVSWDMILPEEV